MSTSKGLIFVTNPIEPKEWTLKVLKKLESHYEIKVGESPFDEQKCMNEIKDAEGILVGGVFPVTRRIMEAAPNLKIISKFGGEVRRIDIEAATELGIIVAYSPLYLISVAEGTILMMLGCLRKIRRAINYIQKGEWKTSLPAEMAGRELFGQTVGIVGFGRVGSRLARMLQIFEVRVLAFDPYVSSDKAAKVGAELVGNLETLLKDSDIVTLHTALTPETHHLIGEKQLRLMKPSAFLINTSRGAVVDQKTLYKALKEGWIAGAALDVFDPEPPDPEDPLLKLDNVLTTPHCTWATEDARRKMFTQVLQNLVDVLQGRLPPKEFIVNPEALEHERVKREFHRARATRVIL